MSSNTQMHVCRVTGGEVLTLDRLLGAGGRESLRHTLEELPTLRENLAPEVARELNWQRAREAGVYECQAGETRISLRLGSGVAQVSYRHESQHDAVPHALAQQIQQEVNRKVNQLVAVAVAQRLEQQFERYRHAQAVPMTITRGLTNQLNIRARAYLTRG